MRTKLLSFFCLACAAALLAFTLHAQTKRKTPVRRAKPPVFKPEDSAGIFFDDVFKEGLVGSRPADLGAPPKVAVTPTPGGGTDGGGSEGGVFAWSKLIPPAIVEDEIKAIKLSVDQNVTTPSKFRSRGYKVARRDFTTAAMLFAIAAEYDGDVRWKDVAHGLREAFARSARNAKAGSPQVYQEANIRKQELGDIVGGAKYNVEGSPERAANWSEVCDRAPLMQRIETAHQGRLQPMTASESEFKKNKDAILHEAAILAAVAQVLNKEGMEDATDDDYADMADRMKRAALTIQSAAKSGEYGPVRAAVGEIGKACAECHETYK